MEVEAVAVAEVGVVALALALALAQKLVAVEEEVVVLLGALVLEWWLALESASESQYASAPEWGWMRVKTLAQVSARLR